MLSSGSNAEIYVQITNGGGQFLTVSAPGIDMGYTQNNRA